MQNFVRFRAKRFRDRVIIRFLRKKNSSAFIDPYVPKLNLIISNNVYFAHIFCAISSTRNRVQRYQIIPEKVQLQRHLWSNFYQKLTDINLY